MILRKALQVIRLLRRCTEPALISWQDEATLVAPVRGDVTDELIHPVMSHEQIAQDVVLRVRSQVITRIGDLEEVNWDMRCWSEDRVDTPRPYSDVYKMAVAVESPHVLFVYGTLKRNCHWHNKYMARAPHSWVQPRRPKPNHWSLGDAACPT